MVSLLMRKRGKSGSAWGMFKAVQSKIDSFSVGDSLDCCDIPMQSAAGSPVAVWNEG